MDLAQPINVLDRGFVRYIDHMGSDEAVIEAARMSTGKGFKGWGGEERCRWCDETRSALRNLHCEANRPSNLHEWMTSSGDEKLLAFMYSHGHMTPFEFGVLHIEVKAPLFVFREWHRHRMQSYSEASARYTQMPNEHYVPPLDRFEPKQTGNKQADSQVAAQADPMYHEARVATEQREIYEQYEEMLRGGVPKEVARINTPVSRYSKMRATTDLRNWLAFLTLRDAPSAQWEIQQYARAVGEIVKALFPRTLALFEEHTKYAVTLSRTEVQQLLKMNNDNFAGFPDSVWTKLNGAK